MATQTKRRGRSSYTTRKKPKKRSSSRGRPRAKSQTRSSSGRVTFKGTTQFWDMMPLVAFTIASYYLFKTSDLAATELNPFDLLNNEPTLPKPKDYYKGQADKLYNTLSATNFLGARDYDMDTIMSVSESHNANELAAIYDAFGEKPYDAWGFELSYQNYNLGYYMKYTLSEQDYSEAHYYWKVISNFPEP